MVKATVWDGTAGANPDVEPGANPAESNAHPPSEDAIRAELDQLIRKSGRGYAEISRLLGRNAAYIQQFIKRGIPRRLSESDRRALSAHFGISESRLGGPASIRLAPGDSHHHLLELPMLGATGRSVGLDSVLLGAFPASPSLAALAVKGDSMSPTLLAGDHVLVDTADNKSPRDGLYAIETGSPGQPLAPRIRRLSVHPVNGRLTILADNAAYPSFPDCEPADVHLLGRIVWVARAIP